MSAYGTKQTCPVGRAMSGVEGTADLARKWPDVAF